MYACAGCDARECVKGMKNPPEGCPGLTEAVAQTTPDYQEEATLRIARVSGKIAPDHSRSRLEQTMAFARECGFERLGLAFCVSFCREAAIVARVLRENGFAVESVMCKVGGLPRDTVGLPGTGRPMCNPLAQARLLNERKTDLNIVMGLCVGHDTLFLQHSQAPATVLAVKDYANDHNPLSGIRCKQAGRCPAPTSGLT